MVKVFVVTMTARRVGGPFACWLWVPVDLREAGVTWPEWVAHRWRHWRPFLTCRCSWCGRFEFILGRRVGDHRDCAPF